MPRLRSLAGRLFSKEGVRGPALTLLSGSSVAMALSLAIQPILTRLYGAEVFGVSDFFVSVVSVLYVAGSLRYEDALMIPQEDEEAASLLGLSLLVTLGMTAVLAVLAGSDTIVRHVVWMEAARPWMWLVPLTFLSMRIPKLGEYWLTRKKRYRAVTAGNVANRVSTSGSRLAAGLAADAGAAGLIGGFITGQAVAAAYYLIVLLQTSGSVLRTAFDVRRMPALAQRFRRFPLFSLPSALVNNVMARLPVFLLPDYFGNAVVGYFGRAFMAVAIPMGLVGQAVGQVFFVEAAAANRRGDLASLTQGVYGRLVMIGLFPAAALVLAAPDIFAVVLGPSWRTAGGYEQYLALWFLLAGVASPLTRVFDVLERQRADLASSLVMFGVLATAIVAGGRTGSTTQTMLYVGVGGAAVRLMHLAVILRLAGVGWRGALRPWIRYTLFAAPFAATLAMASTLDRPGVTTIVAALCGAGYFAVVVWRERLLA